MISFSFSFALSVALVHKKELVVPVSPLPHNISSYYAEIFHFSLNIWNVY